MTGDCMLIKVKPKQILYESNDSLMTAGCFPEKLSLCQNEQVSQGGEV